MIHHRLLPIVEFAGKHKKDGYTLNKGKNSILSELVSVTTKNKEFGHNDLTGHFEIIPSLWNNI